MITNEMFKIHSLTINELENEINRSTKNFYNYLKYHSLSNPLVQECVEQIIYYREWWIVYVNGYTPIWFTPWEFFRYKDEGYLNWKDLMRENINNKTINLVLDEYN